MARLRLPNDLVALIRGLHPEIKRRVRAGLDSILTDPSCGKALKGGLSGLRSVRIRKIRIIYRVLDKGDIEVVALGPRRTIYDETYRRIRKSRKSKD